MMDRSWASTADRLFSLIWMVEVRRCVWVGREVKFRVLTYRELGLNLGEGVSSDAVGYLELGVGLCG